MMPTNWFDIGSNLCESFQIGRPDNDGAFLAGAYLNGEPMISGRIYGPDGDVKRGRS